MEDKIKNIVIKLKLEGKEMFLEDILIAFQENIPEKISDLGLLMKILGGIVLHWRNQYKPLSEQHEQTIIFIYNLLDEYPPNHNQ